MAQPGSWRKERESRPHQCPWPTHQDFSLAPASALPPPLLHLPAEGDRPQSKKDQGRTPEHPLTSRVTLGNPLNLSEPQSPPWRDNMATSGLGCRIMHVAFIIALARHSPAAPGGAAVAIMQVTRGPQLIPCWGQPSQSPQRRAPYFRCFSPCSEDRQCPGAAEPGSVRWWASVDSRTPSCGQSRSTLGPGPKPIILLAEASPPHNCRCAEAPLCSHLAAGVSGGRYSSRSPLACSATTKGAPFKTSPGFPAKALGSAPAACCQRPIPLASSQGQCVFAPAERPALAGASPTALAQGDCFL